MLRYLKCSRRGFFQMGGILGAGMTMVSLSVVMNCPYRDMCPVAFFSTCLVVVLSILMGVALTCVGCSIAHIGSLQEADLAPVNMTSGTKRCGMISKSCPCISRWLLTLSGLAALGGLVSGVTGCPPKGHKEWGQEMCNAPPSSRQPDPMYDFGMVIGCWLMIAAMGCCAARDKLIFPFTYDPTPEEAPNPSTRASVLCRKVTQCCHP